MEKKLFIIFLIAIIGLIFFNTDFCLALSTPINPVTSAVGEGSAILQWEWYENGGILKQFKILYKDINSTVWTARYPVADSGIITYNLMGLAENTTYQWRVKAEAQNPANDSGFIEDIEFTTVQAPTPPPPDDNGGGMGPITLKNPLGQENLWDAIDAILNFLILIAFAIAPILIIYSAFLMIFAAGDAVKINRARTIISWTLIALAVILSAKVLPSVIKGAFSGGFDF